MAHKKAAGSTRNGRDSESKRLGVKKFGESNVQGLKAGLENCSTVGLLGRIDGFK